MQAQRFRRQSRHLGLLESESVTVCVLSLNAALLHDFPENGFIQYRGQGHFLTNFNVADSGRNSVPGIKPQTSIKPLKNSPP